MKAVKPIISDGGRKIRIGSSQDDSDLSKIQLISQTTRANLIQNILGHRWVMPSKKELDYYNPDTSPGNITTHLKKLEEGDLVIRAVVPQGERKRDGPNTFFTLTDDGLDLLKEHALFLPQLEEIRKDHNERLEKTDEIERYESARRPTIKVNYNHPLKGDGVSVVNPNEYVEGFDGKDLLKTPVSPGGEKLEPSGQADP